MEQVGRYQIEGELGRGAMGVVFRALDPAIGRTLAIKTIRLAEFADPAEQGRLRDRLLHEAQSAGILSHPGIVTVYDVAEEGDLAYIAMEFVNGPSLEQMLSADQPLDGETILRVLRETATALDYAHKKGIVHRDIKPANIMVHEDGTVKITDFGVAKISASQQLTQAGTVLGTPSYMSPEQVQGRPVDGRSDEFSLAVIAYEMLTGEKPFAAEQLPTLVYKIVHDQPPPPHLLNATLSWQVEVVLRKALEKDPEQRYATCADFVKALEGACRSSKNWKPLPRGGSQALPTVVTEAAEPPRQRRTRAERERAGRWSPLRKAAVAGAIAVVALAAGTGVYLRWFRVEPPVVQETQVQTEPQPEAPMVPSGRPSPTGPSTESPEPDRSIVPPPQEPPPELIAAQPEAEQEEQPSATAGQSPKPEPPEQTPAVPKAPPKPIRPAPAPPQPSAPVEAVVLVRTSPPGATVMFDNDPKTACKSPCSLSLLEGRHTASATLSGHRPALRIFRVPRDVDLFLYLAKMSGQVQILTTPPGASVLINGEQRRETTPLTLDLPVGKYTITVVKEGYKRDQQAIQVRDNAFLRLDFTLGK